MLTKAGQAGAGQQQLSQNAAHLVGERRLYSPIDHFVKLVELIHICRANSRVKRGLDATQRSCICSSCVETVHGACALIGWELHDSPHSAPFFFSGMLRAAAIAW